MPKPRRLAAALVQLRNPDLEARGEIKRINAVPPQRLVRS